MKTQKSLLFSFLLISIPLIFSCEKMPVEPGRELSISVELIADPPVAKAQSEVTITCRVAGSNNKNVHFMWRTKTGTINGAGDCVSWTAPESPGVYQIFVTIFVGKDFRHADSLRVRVFDPASPLKVIILRSFGNNLPGFWQTLMAKATNYGQTKLAIDFLSFDHDNIAYDELVNSQADVLMIDDARDPSASEILTEYEVESIIKYTEDLHGMIVTGGSLRPNSHKRLASVLGYSSQICGGVYCGESEVDSISIIDDHSALFT